MIFFKIINIMYRKSLIENTTMVYEDDSKTLFALTLDKSIISCMSKLRRKWNENECHNF